MREKVRRKRFESKQRAKILEASIRIFAQKGYKGTTIRALGRSAKVNSALIYYYYENKHNLFTESVRMILRGFLERLYGRHHEFPDARSRLTYMVDTFFDYYSAHPERMRLMVVALCLHSDLVAEALTALVKDNVVAPVEIINEGIIKGELRRMHPLNAWWSIIGLCIFSMLSQDIIPPLASMMATVPPFDSNNRKTQIVDLLMDGFTSRADDGSGHLPQASAAGDHSSHDA
jgi:TetR/AcrR family transcriptional regulator